MEWKTENNIMRVGADSFPIEQFAQAFCLMMQTLTPVEATVIRGLTPCSVGQGRCMVKRYLMPGVMAYSDRIYPISYVPSYLKGKPYLQLANDMKTAKESVLVSFTMNYTGKLFVAVKKGLEPAWIQSGWEQPDTQERDNLDMLVAGRTVNMELYQCKVSLNQEIHLQAPTPGDAMYVVIFGAS